MDLIQSREIGLFFSWKVALVCSHLWNVCPLQSGCGIVFVIQVSGEDMKDTKKLHPFINKMQLINKYSPQSLSTSLSSLIVIPETKLKKSLFSCHHH